MTPSSPWCRSPASPPSADPCRARPASAHTPGACGTCPALSTSARRGVRGHPTPDRRPQHVATATSTASVSVPPCWPATRCVCAAPPPRHCTPTTGRVPAASSKRPGVIRTTRCTAEGSARRVTASSPRKHRDHEAVTHREGVGHHRPPGSPARPPAYGQLIFVRVPRLSPVTVCAGQRPTGTDSRGSEAHVADPEPTVGTAD